MGLGVVDDGVVEPCANVCNFAKLSISPVVQLFSIYEGCGSLLMLFWGLIFEIVVGIADIICVA